MEKLKLTTELCNLRSQLIKAYSNWKLRSQSEKDDEVDDDDKKAGETHVFASNFVDFCETICHCSICTVSG